MISFGLYLASLWRTNTSVRAVASIIAMTFFTKYALFLRPSAHSAIACAVIAVLEEDSVRGER